MLIKNRKLCALQRADSSRGPLLERTEAGSGPHPGASDAVRSLDKEGPTRLCNKNSDIGSQRVI